MSIGAVWFGAPAGHAGGAGSRPVAPANSLPSPVGPRIQPSFMASELCPCHGACICFGTRRKLPRSLGPSPIVVLSEHPRRSRKSRRPLPVSRHTFFNRLTCFLARAGRGQTQTKREFYFTQTHRETVFQGKQTECERLIGPSSVWLANCYFAGPRACNNVTCPSGRVGPWRESGFE
jgi:hypothetical protein